ncbi:MAG: hypothetical protein EXQ52_05020 [Bryobacterales bacterium]|nr:hypothetical protein [Bryobacterales bacterium]
MRTYCSSLLQFALFVSFVAPAASAAVFTVKTVPWVANPLIPHDTYAAKSIRLKGACANCTPAGAYQWTWSFGDGSPSANGTFGAAAAGRYNLEATHTYSGAVGTVFTARLTIQNLSSGETDDEPYYVAMRADSPAVRPCESISLLTRVCCNFTKA